MNITISSCLLKFSLQPVSQYIAIATAQHVCTNFNFHAFVFRTGKVWYIQNSISIESYIITMADIIFSVISMTLNGDVTRITVTRVYMLPVFINLYLCYHVYICLLGILAACQSTV